MLHYSSFPLYFSVSCVCNACKFADIETPSRTTITQESQFSTSQQDPTVAVARRNIQMITGKFSMLVTKSQRKLQIRRISVEDVQTFLITMYSSTGSRDGSDMVISVLQSATSLVRIFHALGIHKLWDYINYYLLQSIIEEFAGDDDELNSLMVQYQRDLTGYILVLNIQTYLKATHYEHFTVTDENEYFKKLRRGVKTRVARQTFWMSMITAVQAVNGIVMVMLAARILGPEGFGLLSIFMGTAALVHGFISAPGQETITAFVTRAMIAEREADAAAVLRMVLVTACVLALCAYALFA